MRFGRRRHHFPQILVFQLPQALELLSTKEVLRLQLPLALRRQQEPSGRQRLPLAQTFLLQFPLSQAGLRNQRFRQVLDLPLPPKDMPAHLPFFPRQLESRSLPEQ